MEKMSSQYVMNAFGSESQSRMKYLYFAHQADKEGFSHVSRLFRAIAYSGFVQAGNHFRTLKHLEGGFVINSPVILGSGSTRENLRLAVLGKDFETAEMYPVCLEITKFQGNKEPEKYLTWSYLVKRVQKKLLVKVRETVNRGLDPELGPIQVCKVCGYTRVGEVPKKCPVCKTTKEYFATFI